MNTDQKPATSYRPGRVLIVDDEPTNHKTLEALLYSEKYTLAFAASGEEALTQLDNFKPDTILLDVMMPGMDGFTACQKIKKNKRWQHIPIILVTALDSRETLKEGFAAGANDFLTKPVNSIELRARVRSMIKIKQQYDDLEAALQLREDMAHMIAHDMRNPLTTIQGYSDLLVKVSLPAEQVIRAAKYINTEARRLNGFINDMLLLAKMEQSQLRLNLTPVNINELLLTAREHHTLIAEAKHIALIVDVPPRLPAVPLDLNLFQRVVDNLVSNAIKYAPENTTVTLTAAPLATDDHTSPARRVRIKVIDQGPGIAPKQREQIFKKFDTGSFTNKRVLQIGLGLAFSKMVVEAHHGTLTVEDNQPTGSIFIIEV